jgi:lichenan operon transcriptional antiterminator
MIAIPHPSDCRAARSAIAVSLLRKPLSWGTSSVRIIFMICVSKSDLSDFSDIFSYLPRVCSDYKTLEQLASASSYPDFIQILGGLCAE